MGAFARTLAIHDLRSWAAAIVGLDAGGPLPSRVVLVPSEDVAHALRVDLVETAPHALIGTRFLTAPAAASAVLDRFGVQFVGGEESRRSLRVRSLLRERPQFETFSAFGMTTVGWEDAIASSISELEMSCLGPGDLDRIGTGRARDVAMLWRALDDDAALSWTLARVMREATARLRDDPTAWPFAGQTLAYAPLGIDRTHAELVSAIPRTVLGVVVGRPAREDAIARFRSLLGAEAACVLCAVPASNRESELGILSDLVFETPERLADASRRRSAGSDGSVVLERHAGVDEELDATARWVASEVVEHGTPLRQLAVLFPTAEPYAALVVERIRALEWPTDAKPLYASCGVPAVTTSSGTRLLAIVTAVRDYLPAATLVEVLPRFRSTTDNAHLSPGQARKVVRELATLGGSAARPAGALEWRARLHRSERGESVAAVSAPLEALVAIAEGVVARRTLSELWRAFRELVATYVLGTDALTDLVQQLGTELEALVADGVSDDVRGAEAVQVIERTLRQLRIFDGRYGEASIYVGTITAAAGLRFTSVRILGLVEGAFPGIQKEDAIIPVSLREKFPSGAMSTDGDYAAGRLHALDRVIRGTSERLVLSMPRTYFDGSEREPASLVIDIASALGRPDPTTGTRARVVPDLNDLERDAFRVARQVAADAIEAQPLTVRCQLHRSARSSAIIPAAWSAIPVTDPIAIQLRERSMHGALGPEPLTATIYGLTAEPKRALSFSAMRDLLECPQRFLMRRMVGFRPREIPASAHRIDELAFGSLVHTIVEAFLRKHGASFGSRTEPITYWQQIVDRFAAEHFEVFVNASPLRGEEAMRGELQRLRLSLLTWVTDDWNEGRPRGFVAVEHEFGGDPPLPLTTRSGPLYVQGRIDRIDTEAGATLVRDLKTGRSHPRIGRDADVSLELDLQLALYALVARHVTAELGLPSNIVAAYTYLDPWAADRARAFREDADTLVAIGQTWIDVAAAILREQSYVRTPSRKDCRYCAFRPVCGDDTLLAGEPLAPTGAATAFLELRQ